ncbi:MAG: hypothetical protein ACXVDN_22895 [Ktedonobacteraceae bacterium]
MATGAPKGSIFRSKTVQKYTQNREKSVLPRVVTPPVFVLCWIILGLLTAAGITAWSGQVPLYVAGSGVILNQSTSTNQSNGATAAIVLPASDVSNVRVGLPIQVHIGQSGPSLNRAVDSIGQNLLSPSQIQQKYGLGVAEPSLVVTVGLGAAIPESLYAGSLVQAQVQIGSQSLLSLFPVFNNLLKDK